MKRRILLAACFGLFLVQLDLTIVNIALPEIEQALAASVTSLQWVVDAYTLMLASFMLSAGELADIYGRRRVFVGGLVLFSAASAGGALCATTRELIACRMLQGIGAAAALPASLAVVSHAHPKPELRSRAIGLWAGISAVALVLGPSLGGMLLRSLGWRSLFWVNVPVGAAAVACAFAWVPESAEARARRPDWAGQAAATAALASLLVLLIEGRRAGWRSPVAAASAAAMLLASAALAAIERRAERPMMEAGVLADRSFASANAASALMNFGAFGALFVFSIFLQSVQGENPLGAGLRLLALFAPMALLLPAGGALVARAGPRAPAVAGLSLSGAATLLLARVGPATSHAFIGVFLALAGVGLAAATPAVVTAAVGAVGPERSGMASAFNNTCRQAGGALGVAVCGGFLAPPSPLAGGVRAGIACAGAVLLAAALAGAGVANAPSRRGGGAVRGGAA